MSFKGISAIELICILGIMFIKIPINLNALVVVNTDFDVIKMN